MSSLGPQPVSWSERVAAAVRRVSRHYNDPYCQLDAADPVTGAAHRQTIGRHR